MSEVWTSISNKPPFGVEKLGFSEEWIDEDYNPDGICMCFLNDDMSWTISKWCGQHDEWHTRNDADDDLNTYESRISPPTLWRDKPIPPSKLI